MQVTKSKKVAAVLGAGAITVAGAGVAFAAWSSTGSGAATASSTTSANSVIAAGTHAANLYPGATQSVTVTISNPNAYPVLVTSISAGSSDLVNTNCAAGSVTTDARTLDATGLVQSDDTTKTIAGNGSGTFTLVSKMIANPDNACKSQDFNLPLTATLVSNAS